MWVCTFERSRMHVFLDILHATTFHRMCKFISFPAMRSWSNNPAEILRNLMSKSCFVWSTWRPCKSRRILLHWCLRGSSSTNNGNCFREGGGNYCHFVVSKTLHETRLKMLDKLVLAPQRLFTAVAGFNKISTGSVTRIAVSSSEWLRCLLSITNLSCASWYWYLISDWKCDCIDGASQKKPSCVASSDV